jgi:4-hydroxybenzoate polyprenyltransferase
MTRKTFSSYLRQVIKVSRPFSWINTAAPYAAGYLLAVGGADLGLWLGITYFLLPYNLAMYGINDIYDYESDIKNPRKDSIEGGIVDPTQRKGLWLGITVLNIPFLAYFLATGSSSSRIVLTAVAFLCVSYSIKGLRFKEKPFLDSINSACHFVGPMLFGLIYGGSTNLYLPILAAFMLWGMASQALGAIQDIAPDRSAGIHSIATYLGARRTNSFVLIAYLLCCAIVILAYWPLGLWAGLLLLAYPLNVAFFRKYRSDAQSKHYRRSWQNFLWLNWLIGFSLTQLILFFTDPLKLGVRRWEAVAASLAFIGLGQLALATYNILVLKRPKKLPANTELPSVSIIIHALNQADNISSTLLSAIGQSYPQLEVLFADLGSDDNTLKLARGFQDSKLRIVDIPQPDVGWEPHAWAADQLTQQAKGEIVISVAADTILLPNAVAAMVSQIIHEKLQLLSLLPADQNKTLAQKLILNQNHFLLLGCYPAGLIETKHPRINLAYSGLIGFRKDALMDIRGFERTRKSPIPEMELARQATAAGLRTSFRLASDVATSQNHATFDMIFRDNLTRYYPALQFNMPLTLSAVILGSFLFITPGVGIAASAIIAPSTTPLWLGAYVCGLLPRLLVSTSSRQGVLGAALYPISSVVTIFTLLASMLHYELFKPRWQKRTELQ